MQVKKEKKNRRINRNKQTIRIKIAQSDSKEELFKVIVRMAGNRKAKQLLDSQYEKSHRVVLSPVFSTKEQEKTFAKCAKECMSTEASLSW